MNRDLSSRSDAAAFAAPADLGRLQSLSLIVGAVGLAACGVGAFLSPDYALRSWLVGWMLCLGVALGCTALAMLNHLTGGDWGLVVRRVFEAASRTLPLLLVLFIPIALGVRRLYEWARPEAAHDALLQAKAPYLNVPFFLVRVVIYFLIWYGFSFFINRLSARQDREADPTLPRRMSVFAAPGLIAYCLTITFASVDWLMSLQPHWYSTIYGLYLLASQGLSAFAFIIIFALYLSRRAPMDRVLQPRHFHDWGKLMFAFTMLWAYFSFSQFLITWAGNLPEEIAFFLPRMRGGWGFVFLFIALFHFLIPYLLLLSRDLKRDARRLVWIAVWILFMRLVELFWQVEPAFHDKNPGFYWLYIAAPIGIGGVWFWFFLYQLKKRPLLPINDPFLPEAIAHE
jgi:hypothetical protein